MPLSDDLQPEEIDIMQRVSGLPLDHLANAVATNIWRAAQELKSKMERTLLREFELTWASFSTLFIVWIWGPIETRDIAKSQNVTKGTVTSAVSLLEKRGLCLRRQSEADRRLVTVELTTEGQHLIEEVYPLFNQGESELVSGLSVQEQETLAHLLRKAVKSIRQQRGEPV
jgi:DNA-binding MarR family transcriptional regulator